MKIIISQPMNGKTTEQINEERKKIVSILTEEGFEVVDNIISEEPPKNMNEAIYYLAKSVEFIGQADAVFFMKGWEKARGCKIEHQVAVEYSKKIYYEN